MGHQKVLPPETERRGVTPAEPNTGRNGTENAFSLPVLAVGAVIFSEGRLLLVRRCNPPEANRWAIPGGKVKAGESVREAVIRETLEETGLRVEVTDAFWVGEVIGPGNPPAWHFVFLDFLVEVLGGRAQHGDDAAELVWSSLTDLGGIPLAAGMEDLITKIRPIWDDRMPKEGRE